MVLEVDLLSKGCATTLLRWARAEVKLKQDSRDDAGDTGVGLTTTTRTPGGGDTHTKAKELFPYCN